MYNKKYKIGDKVYTNKCSFWGMCEMEVNEVLENTANCYNRMVGASGGFCYPDLYKVDSKKGIEHTQTIKKINAIDDKIDTLNRDKNELLDFFNDVY